MIKNDDELAIIALCSQIGITNELKPLENREWSNVSKNLIEHHKTPKDLLDKTLLNNLNAKKVVFDLSGLSFMDSTGIGLLIGRYKKLKQFNISAYISGASVSTEKVIELAGLYKIMPKY